MRTTYKEARECPEAFPCPCRRMSVLSGKRRVNQVGEVPLENAELAYC
jgi:hypothetical protein